ncbi:MAG: hypothetical protein NC319_05885 [Butyricicoccus sp.]|nr:hypothetical protein [Butyricicoccus sp.]
MNALSQFQTFNCADFFTEKDLTVTSCGPLKNFKTKAIEGSRLEVCITRDGTHYDPPVKKDGTTISNLYEKLTVKVPGKTLTMPVGAVVTLVNPIGTIWGDYRNQLSVTAEDVQAVTAAGAPKGKD